MTGVVAQCRIFRKRRKSDIKPCLIIIYIYRLFKIFIALDYCLLIPWIKAIVFRGKWDTIYR